MPQMLWGITRSLMPYGRLTRLGPSYSWEGNSSIRRELPQRRHDSGIQHDGIDECQRRDPKHVLPARLGGRSSCKYLVELPYPRLSYILSECKLTSSQDIYHFFSLLGLFSSQDFIPNTTEVDAQKHKNNLLAEEMHVCSFVCLSYLLLPYLTIQEVKYTIFFTHAIEVFFVIYILSLFFLFLAVFSKAWERSKCFFLWNETAKVAVNLDRIHQQAIECY